MIRLALITQADQLASLHKTETSLACARLRGIELTVVTDMSHKQELHQSDQFDAVLIHAPIDCRNELTCHFAKSGKHVLIYGPLSATMNDASKLIACCREGNVRLMIGGTVRFQPAIIAIKGALDSNRLGIPALLRSHSWRAIEPAEVVDNEQQLFEQLDLAMWIFDGLPTTVFATRHDDRTDTLQIHVGYPSGGMGLITICKSLPAGHRYCSCSLIGSNGAAYSDDLRQMQLLFQGNSPRAERTTEGILSHVEELREFVTAIEQQREPSVSGADGQQALQLAIAVRRSIEIQQPLKLEGGSYVPVN